VRPVEPVPEIDEVPAAQVARDPLLDADLFHHERSEVARGLEASLLETAALLAVLGPGEEQPHVAERAARAVVELDEHDAPVAPTSRASGPKRSPKSARIWRASESGRMPRSSS